ncbi:geranylgeranyl reductase family protein [bacterium]|nr:geranylgeranyl reductase family protein [bacterium]
MEGNFVAMYTVDAQKCAMCWGCISVCPADAIFQGKSSVLINPDLCDNCGLCEKVCPTGAIVNEDHSETAPQQSARKDIIISEPDTVRECDVVIIGGGPGGLSAAYFASRAGFSVCVIERREKFGIPVACAEGISTEGLTRVFEPKREWISTTIEGALIFSPDGEELFVDHPRAGFVLNRPKMESGIAEMAKDSGAEIFTSTQALRISGKNFAESVIAKRNGEILKIYAKYFIGADGIGGISRRWAFPQKQIGLMDIETCAQVLLKTEEITENIPEFHWGSEIAPGGYAWVFPKGKNLANVGLGIVPSIAKNSPQEFFKNFIARRFSKYKIIERRDGIVPTTMRFKPPGRGNLLLVGDAALFTNSISGTGIDTALFSGKIAAEVIAEMHGQSYIKMLKEYDNRWKNSLGRQLDLYARLRNGILKLSDEEMNKIAGMLRRQLSGRKWTALNIPKIVRDIVFFNPKLLKIARHFL